MTDQYQQIRALIKQLEDMSIQQKNVSAQLFEALAQANTSREDMAELLEIVGETYTASAKLITTAAMIAKEKELGCNTRELFRKRHDLIAAVH